MPIEKIQSLDDPRVAPYRELKDRELAKQGNLFIAEGEHVTCRLLASDFPVHSVLLAERHLEMISKLAKPEITLFVAPDDVVDAIVGFKFHSGLLGCGVRKPSPTLEEVLSSNIQSQNENAASTQAVAAKPLTWLVCPEIINHDNLGALIRIAAAFGVGALVLGPTSCDPFWRRSIRVSMGTIFRLPVIRSENLERDLTHLQQAHQFELLASVLDDQAQPLAQATRKQRLALLIGNEAQGLSRRHIALCDRKITIPMQVGIDSLNVSIATAVMLYHFTQVQPN